MKRCRECYQTYPDSENFCELDGQSLVVDVAVTPPVGNMVQSAAVIPETSSHTSDAPVMVIVGVLVGVLLASIVYGSYAYFASAPPSEESTPAVTRVQTVDPNQPRRAPRSEIVEPSPEAVAEASPTPEVEEEAKAATSEENTVSARLNQGPVSTGERKRSGNEQTSEKTIIEMNDGSRIEVDAAWQDKQGLWYRRGGLVSFVESKRVKGIQAARQEPNSEALSSPTPGKQ